MSQTMLEERQSVAEPPIDIAHLARQTLGHRKLEKEVLALFVSHSAIQMTRLRGAADAGERRAAAHSIKGAARGIGAWAVARIAGEIEGEGGDAGPAIEALEQAIEAARTHIGVLIEG